MSRLHRGAIAVLLSIAAGIATSVLPAQPIAGGGIAGVERGFSTPPDDSRIMMRWWWFGPSMTDAQIDAELHRMKEGGIGGFEIAPVYPLAIDESADGLRNYPYLSAEFLDRIGAAARKARELGLRMDVTLGSGWPFGGPHIDPSLAAMRLRLDRREIAPDVARAARPVPYEHERLVAAFVGRGSLQEVDPDSFQELDLAGSGPIALPAAAGPRTLLFYFASPTGQTVKRAALGAEGYVLDHYNRAAVERHLHEVGDKLLAAAGPGGIYAVFCDSLEVYDANWTGDMLAEFAKRRGYDLRPLLPLLDYAPSSERAQRVRSDLGRTQTELYEERFSTPIRDWARGHGVKFRIQGYGSPPAALSSYRFADLIDGEGFDWRTLSSTRWAASAAHLLGHPVAASETWTWVHSPAFRATPLDLKAEADEHFLSGINQLIGHGWPSSPPQAGTPGRMFYAAGALNDSNPWWPVMPDLAAYLQRVSFLLRQGAPVADVAIYAPADDARAAMRPGVSGYLNLWMGIRDRIGAPTVSAILDAGYAFDLIDDGTLKEAQARRYKAVVLPNVRWMPEQTRRWIGDYAAAGGTVIALHRAPDGMSLPAVTDRALASRLASSVPPDVTMTPATPQIGFVHRRLEDAQVYFVTNTSNTAHDVAVAFRDASGEAEIWNPMDGSMRRLALEKPGIAHLEFQPYESHVVVFRARARAASAGDDASPSTAGSPADGAPIDGGAGWTFRRAGGSARPVALPHSWSDDPDTRYFSGAGIYERTFELGSQAREPGTRIVLDFGDVRPIEREPLPDGTLRGNSFAALVAPPIREAAEVFVNGRRAGSLWAPPYRLDLTAFVRPGPNDLRVEVYNTAINELAQGGRVPDVAAVTERYGQRFRLQDMEGLQPIPSGILVVPRIRMER